jgi:hypothetical protein
LLAQNDQLLEAALARRAVTCELGLDQHLIA